MDKITISDGTTTITMPRTRKVTDIGKRVTRQKEMASKKIVEDVIGFRHGFAYEWDYVPAETITALISMLRTKLFFTVNYFDVDGEERSGTCEVSYPQFKVFTFRAGVAVWHMCKLEIMEQEVSAP